MGNYDLVRELAGTFKVLASLMVALDGPIARLGKHWFVASCPALMVSSAKKDKLIK